MHINSQFLRLCNCLGVSFLLTALAGLAADLQTQPPRNEPSPAPAASTVRPESAPSIPGRLGMLQGAKELLGKSVRDDNELSVGKLEDLILDLPNSRVVAVEVVSGPNAVLVPAKAFVVTDKNLIGMKCERKIFSSAPRLPRAGVYDSSSLTASFDHFQEPPLANSITMPASAALLLGATVTDQGQQPLGKVEDIMLDVPLGGMAYVVVKPSVGPDLDGTLYAVPPSALEFDSAKRTAILKTDQSRFVAGPHFKKDFPAELTRPGLAAAVRQHYGLKPDVSARSSIPGKPGVLTDDEITEAIVTQVIRENDVVMGRDLKVTTVNGKVTLAGKARNEKQHQQFIAAADRVVGPANVNDRIEP